jgi:nicotinate-nucleotide pyrophosphorylase (carboxylating)
MLNFKTTMDFPSLSKRLNDALREDGAFRDVTTQLLKKYGDEPLIAELVAKKHGVFCGGFLIKPVFGQLDSRLKTTVFVKDGGTVRPGMKVARIRARARALLAGERVFLNLACHLSGVATFTRQFVTAVKGTGAHIVDTRKTTPLWRDLEKHAVFCGGGGNHRMSLSEAVLVKDNHLQILKRHGASPAEFFDSGAIRRPGIAFVEMEAATVEQVWDAICANVDAVLLDNMPVKLLKESIALICSARQARGTPLPLIEVSGGVSLQNVRRLAQLGVDRISVGALTHSAPALDLSLEVL